MPNKRGRISRDEDKKIAAMLAKEASPEAIAQALSRPVAQIEQHIKKFYGKGEDLPEEAPEIAEFSRLLRNSIHWKKLQEQYNKEDLEYYETIYGTLMSQFKHEITPVDDMQILQAIDSHMLINEHKKRSKIVNDRLNLIELEVSKLRKEGEKENIEQIISLDNQRQALMAQNNQGVRVFTDLSKKFDDTVSKLKSTRDQRLKNEINSTQSWIALIKTMQDEKVREREGKYAAMVKHATNVKSEEIQQPYKYINGEVDQPMLVPENILISLPADAEIEQEAHSE